MIRTVSIHFKQVDCQFTLDDNETEDITVAIDGVPVVGVSIDAMTDDGAVSVGTWRDSWATWYKHAYYTPEDIKAMRTR